MSFVFKHRHNKKDVVGKQRNFWSQNYNNALSMYQALEIAWLNASKKSRERSEKGNMPVGWSGGLLFSF